MNQRQENSDFSFEKDGKMPPRGRSLDIVLKLVIVLLMTFLSFFMGVWFGKRMSDLAVEQKQKNKAKEQQQKESKSFFLSESLGHSESPQLNKSSLPKEVRKGKKEQGLSSLKIGLKNKARKEKTKKARILARIPARILKIVKEPTKPTKAVYKK